MSRRLLPVAALLLAAVPAQDRRAALGRVLDADGRPIAGAAVTLVRSEACAIGLVDADLVRATSDASGWFKAELLLGALYDGWAIGPERDGGAACGPVLRAIAAGATRELRCGAVAAPTVLQVEGVEAWGVGAPLACELYPDERSPLALPLPLPADGKVPVPPLPDARHALALRSADGELLYWHSFGTGAPALRLPPPVAVPVQAVDEQGTPVAGARIAMRVAQVMMPTPFDVFGVAQRSLWRELGRTGADGKACVQVPLDGDPFQGGKTLVLRASADGCADSHSGWMNGPFRDGQRLDDDAKVERVEFVLHPAYGGRGRLLAAADRPIAGARLRLAAISKVARDGGWTHLPRVFDLRTDEAGFYAVPQLPVDAYDFEVLLATPAELTQPLAGGRKPVRPALAPLLPLQPGHAAALPEVDLRQTVEVAVRVLDPTSGPARGAIGVVYSLGEQARYVPGGLHPTFAVDPAGRVDLRLWPGRWLCCCLGDAGFASAEIDTGVADAGKLELQLQPFASRRCRVVGAGGAPVVGARAEPAARGHQGSGGFAADLLARLRDAVDGHLLAEARSDADGMLLLRVLAGDDRPGGVRVAAGDLHSEPFAVATEQRVLEVVLR